MHFLQLALKLSNFFLLLATQVHLFEQLASPFHFNLIFICEHVYIFGSRDQEIPMQTGKQSVDDIFKIVLDLCVSLSAAGTDPILQGIQEQVDFVNVGELFVLAGLGQT